MVRPDALPRASPLRALRQPGDFLDCYSAPPPLSPRQAATRGLAPLGRAAASLSLRNTPVRPFGRKTGTPDKPVAPTCRENVNVLGTDDRHLDVRFGPIRAGGHISMSAWAHPQNA